VTGSFPPDSLKDKGLPSPEDEKYPIRIARDGTWFYHGSPIGRIELVKLFATVLRRDEAGDYWLITPAERGRIVVEDVPFVAVELQQREDGLHFRTNIDHWVRLDAEHPLSWRAGVPYILVRASLEARLATSVYYELAALVENGGVASAGQFFAFGDGHGA
jgi:hypothetical protein